MMYEEGTTMYEVRRIRNELDEEYLTVSPAERELSRNNSMNIFLERMKQAGKTIEKTNEGK